MLLPDERVLPVLLVLLLVEVVGAEYEVLDPLLAALPVVAVVTVEAVLPAEELLLLGLEARGVSVELAGVPDVLVVLTATASVGSASASPSRSAEPGSSASVSSAPIRSFRSSASSSPDSSASP